MPKKKGWKLKEAVQKRGRNEFNEFTSGSTDTSSCTKETETETTEAPDPIIQIAQAVRVLASQDLDGRNKRAVVKEIALQLTVVNTTLTEALQSAHENRELKEILIARIDALPPALSREQQCALAVLDEVNVGRDAPLSVYLIKERLKSKGKARETAKKRANLALERQIATLLADNKAMRLALQTRNRKTNRARQAVVEIQSPSNRQKIAQEVVLSNIKTNADGNGAYTTAAKRKIVELGGEARSLSAAPKAIKAALQLCLPLADEASIDRAVPCRKSITKWTLQEPEYDQRAAFEAMGNSKFGVLADGSKRARKDLFLVAIFWFCFELACVFTKLVNIVDLRHDASAEAMAKALIWTLQVRCELNMKNMVYFCTDNTNSMSGLNGGCVALLCQGLDRALLPRAPCSLHVWHLAIRAMRSVIYFGTMPSRTDRATKHLWNFLYACAKLFCKAHPDYTTWKTMCAAAGYKLTITWMPVDTRWLFECFAAQWALDNLLLLRWLHDEVKRKFGKTAVASTAWKNINFYISDINFIIELLVFCALHRDLFK
jgi:hypothetical protein